MVLICQHIMLEKGQIPRHTAVCLDQPSTHKHTQIGTHTRLIQGHRFWMRGLEQAHQRGTQLGFSLALSCALKDLNTLQVNILLVGR